MGRVSAGCSAARSGRRRVQAPESGASRCPATFAHGLPTVGEPRGPLLVALVQLCLAGSRLLSVLSVLSAWLCGEVSVPHGLAALPGCGGGWHSFRPEFPLVGISQEVC